MSRISLQVEVNLGTDVTKAIQEMLELANHLDVCVKSIVNGINIFIKPGDNLSDIVDKWSNARKVSYFMPNS